MRDFWIPWIFSFSQGFQENSLVMCVRMYVEGEKYFQRLTLMTVFTFNFAFINLPVVPISCLFLVYGYKFRFCDEEKHKWNIRILRNSFTQVLFFPLLTPSRDVRKNLSRRIPYENIFLLIEKDFLSRLKFPNENHTKKFFNQVIKIN